MNAPAATVGVSPGRPPQPAPGVLDDLALVGLGLALLGALAWLRRRTRSAAVTDPLGGRWIAAALGWQGLVAVLATLGAFQAFDQPWRALVAVAPALSLAAWLALRPSSGAGLQRTPRAFWPAVQLFRLPLELLLHRLMTGGVIGPQMTFAGGNFDIVVGVTAPAAAWLAARAPASAAMQRALLAWNAAGLALLFTILAIAVLSVPFPFQHFGRGPANLMVADFPFIWLPTWFIPVALYAHLASMRLAWGDLRQHRTARNSRRHTA